MPHVLLVDDDPEQLEWLTEFVKGEGFHPIGFELFGRMQKVGLEPVDIVSVVRHNKTLEMGNYRRAAEEGNFFLRGFNYLFIMRKS